MLLQLRDPPRTAVLWALSAASTAGAWAASLAVVRRLGAQQLWDAEAQGMIAGALARGGRWAAGLRFLASGASPARRTRSRCCRCCSSSRTRRCCNGYLRCNHSCPRGRSPRGPGGWGHAWFWLRSPSKAALLLPDSLCPLPDRLLRQPLLPESAPMPEMMTARVLAAWNAI